jgi:fatty-acyl-CoA synthase
VLETVADVRADRTAVTHGDRNLTWRQLDDRASRLAAFLAGRGVGAEDRVAIALYNGTAYLESVFAVLKLRAIPVNVNYRYQPEEMLHLFDDAQVAALIFDASLGARVAQAGAATLHTMVQVGGAAAAPVSAYDQVIDGAAPLPRTSRGVDHWLMYTGGTTGKPKGVLVSHSWLYPVACANGFRLIGEPVPDSLERARRRRHRLPAGPPAHARDRHVHHAGRAAGQRAGRLPDRALLRPGRARAHRGRAARGHGLDRG